MDARKVELALELSRRYPEDPEAGQGPPHVLRTGESQLIAEITEEGSPSSRSTIFTSGSCASSAFRVTWACRSSSATRSLGVISFVAAESGRRYGPDDLALAEELARRAGIAVENAQLYREVEERAQAARVLETVGDGVFLIDLDGVVRLWNRAAESITRLSRSEVRRQRGPVTCCPAGSMPRRRVPLEFDGKERWLSITGVALRRGHGLRVP